MREYAESNLEMFAILDLPINIYVYSFTALKESIIAVQDLFRNYQSCYSHLLVERSTPEIVFYCIEETEGNDLILHL